MEYRVSEEKEEQHKGWQYGYLILGGIGVVGYMLGSKMGFKRGLRNPIVKSYVEKVDYSDVGKIISRTITQTFGYDK